MTRGRTVLISYAPTGHFGPLVKTHSYLPNRSPIIYATVRREAV